MAGQQGWFMDPDKNHDTITVDLTDWDQPNAANEIYVSDFDSMITTITPTPVPAITIGDSTSWNWNADTITMSEIQPTAKLSLDGEDADIEINGESLLAMIRGIQDRLNILTPDRELEQEWQELRDLREQYEAKLTECREKSAAWKALKS